MVSEKKTGFALWRINDITHLNDLKWTKPGHITLKVFANNLQFIESSTNQLKSNRKNCKKFKLSQSNTNSTINSSRIDDKILTFKPSMSFNNARYLNGDSFNECSDFNLLKNTITAPNDPNKYVFAAVKFDNDFECSRFYDFYRLLFNNPKNHDLFNPNYSYKSASNVKNNLFQIFYKKIAKNSISSPCAFRHINSLSIQDEDAHRLESISDSQSITSDDSTTITSNNDSSIIFNFNNKK